MNTVHSAFLALHREGGYLNKEKCSCSCSFTDSDRVVVSFEEIQNCRTIYCVVHQRPTNVRRG